MLEVFTFIIALILVVLPITDWTASVILHRASKRAHSIALRERAVVAIILACASSLNGTLGLIRLLDVKPGPLIITLILSASFLLVGIPNLYWLSLYFRNRLRK